MRWNERFRKGEREVLEEERCWHGKRWKKDIERGRMDEEEGKEEEGRGESMAWKMNKSCKHKRSYIPSAFFLSSLCWSNRLTFDLVP